MFPKFDVCRLKGNGPQGRDPQQSTPKGLDARFRGGFSA
jgi:hypothetical protein